MAYLQCTLFRSAFSRERMFRISLPKNASLGGVAPLHYCFDRNGKRIGKDDLAPNREIIEFIHVEILDCCNVDNFSIELRDNKRITVEHSINANLSPSQLTMYLSDRHLHWAIRQGCLIVKRNGDGPNGTEQPPKGIGSASNDLGARSYALQEALPRSAFSEPCKPASTTIRMSSGDIPRSSMSCLRATAISACRI
jgi:hypothetical protein